MASISRTMQRKRKRKNNYGLPIVEEPPKKPSKRVKNARAKLKRKKNK